MIKKLKISILWEQSNGNLICYLGWMVLGITALIYYTQTVNDCRKKSMHV